MTFVEKSVCISFVVYVLLPSLDRIVCIIAIVRQDTQDSVLMQQHNNNYTVVGTTVLVCVFNIIVIIII